MNSPKYDLRLNPVYQIDFAASSKGKRVAATKRRVRFRFGFSNPEAIAQGLTGMHCRGEEHEVTLVWSLTSGKRVVTADEQEVHFSQGKRTDLKFDCSWTMKGNHVMKLVAHATPAVLGNNPGFRQFELFLDGMSFFDMPRIFELGVVSGNRIVESNRENRMAFAAPSPSYEDPALAYETRGYVPEQDCYATLNQSVQGYEFSQDTNRSPRLEHAPQQRYEQQHSESMPLDLMSAPTTVQDHLAAAPVTIEPAQSFTSAPAPIVDEFTPVAPPPPTYNDVSNQILSAYGPPAPAEPALPALAYESHTYGAPAPAVPETSFAAPVQAPPVQNFPPYAQQMYVQTFAPPQETVPMGPSTPASEITNPSGVFTATPSFAESRQPQQEFQESPTSVRQVSDVDQALQNLVNLDDISEPAMSPMKLTMLKEEAEKKKNKNKGVPLPPTAPSWQLGAQPTLADIQSHAAPRSAPTKEVMRTHAFDPAAQQAGTMVVYGSAPTEAPPIQYHGFGYHGYGAAFAAH